MGYNTMTIEQNLRLVNDGRRRTSPSIAAMPTEWPVSQPISTTAQTISRDQWSRNVAARELKLTGHTARTLGLTHSLAVLPSEVAESLATRGEGKEPK